MPALPQTVIKDITGRLETYLGKLGKVSKLTFLGSGGSAAVFRADSSCGPRAIKVLDPSFMSSEAGHAEKRRLNVQRRLIGHTCSSLVQTYKVDEAEGTAFMEMEFVEWPQLTKLLSNVPDEAVASLISQLVIAVRFLEEKGIVHRDIKPENIHISPDYKFLKLLDLGVAREFQLMEGDAASVTDHGNLRPFLATAQYSSPEYLFRLDEPSARLWHGLNFYQVGAVLHDLIMKKPIFQEEIETGNRWLLARAVLTKSPSFDDGNHGRLVPLKAIAARCLVKDIDRRLQLVGWNDFVADGGGDALTALRSRLTKGRLKSDGSARGAAESRLSFERSRFTELLCEHVRSELISTCGTHLPLTVKLSEPGAPPQIVFELSANEHVSIRCSIDIVWLAEIYERTANINMIAWLAISGRTSTPSCLTVKPVYTATISEDQGEGFFAVSNAIAEVVSIGLDLIDSATDMTELNAVDLQNLKKSGEESK